MYNYRNKVMGINNGLFRKMRINLKRKSSNELVDELMEKYGGVKRKKEVEENRNELVERLIKKYSG